MTKATQFHIQYSPPFKTDYVEWPAGCWSLYEISGDEIADRIKRDTDGNVTERWPWCGFVGCFGSLEALSAAMAERVAAK